MNVSYQSRNQEKNMALLCSEWADYHSEGYRNSEVTFKYRGGEGMRRQMTLISE